MLWTQPLRRYFQFSGRASRAEYWQFIAAAVAAYLIAATLDVGREGLEGTPSLALLVMLGLGIPAYAVTFRRLHDRGVTGWVIGLQWILNGIYFAVDRMRAGTRGSLIDAPFALINGVDIVLTLALAIYIVVQLSRPGDAIDNAYGPPPVDQVDMPPSHGSAADRVAELERLTKLHRSGVLTDAEFEHQKAAVLTHE
jgi:uncharacterized membrane protein YhaH (DUF805 family)